MLILVVVLVIIGLIVTATISQFLSKGRKRASVPGGKRYIGLIIVSIITRVLGWTMIVLTGIAGDVPPFVELGGMSVAG